jgi:hypothetical protein
MPAACIRCRSSAGPLKISVRPVRASPVQKNSESHLKRELKLPLAVCAGSRLMRARARSEMRCVSNFERDGNGELKTSSGRALTRCNGV